MTSSCCNVTTLIGDSQDEVFEKSRALLYPKLGNRLDFMEKNVQESSKSGSINLDEYLYRYVIEFSDTLL